MALESTNSHPLRDLELGEPQPESHDINAPGPQRDTRFMGAPGFAPPARPALGQPSQSNTSGASTLVATPYGEFPPREQHLPNIPNIQGLFPTSTPLKNIQPTPPIQLIPRTVGLDSLNESKSNDTPDESHVAPQPVDPSVTTNTLPKATPAGDPMAAPATAKDSVTNSDQDIWNMYEEDAEKFDLALIENWNRTIDVLLIFAALFSAVLAAFIIESYKGLSPDPNDPMISLLQRIDQHLESRFAPNDSNPSAPSLGATPATFTPSYSTIRVNCAWFLSLNLSLGVAVVSVVAKQWLSNYAWYNVSGSAQERSRLRQFRYNELRRWRVPEIISLLPTLLLAALALFFGGLVEFLLGINFIVAVANAALIGVFVLFLLISITAPLFIPRCPYKTSLSDMLRPISMRIYHLWWTIGNLYSYSKHRLFSREPGDSREQSAAMVEEIGPKFHFSGSRLAIQQAEWEDLRTYGVDTIDAHAFAWLIDSSSIHDHVIAAVKACIRLPRTDKNVEILKDAGVTVVIEAQLFSLLKRTDLSLSKEDACTAGACARILCLLDNPVPSFALASALDACDGSSSLASLYRHADGNVACYVNCAVLMMLLPFSNEKEIALTVRLRAWDLERLLRQHVQGEPLLTTQTLVQLLDTLNRLRLRGFEFEINKKTVERAAALLTSITFQPAELNYNIIIMLLLYYSPGDSGLIRSKPRISQLIIRLLSLSATIPKAIPEDILLSVLGSMSNPVDGGAETGRSAQSDICTALCHLLRPEGSRPPSEELYSTIAGVVRRLGSHVSSLKYLRDGGIDSSLAHTLSDAYSEKTWVEVCNCLEEVSGQEERAYDGALSVKCMARLNETTSEDELVAIVSLMVVRKSLWCAFLDRQRGDGLQILARHIRGHNKAITSRLLLRTADGLLTAMGGRLGQHPAADSVVSSQLLLFVSERLLECPEVFGDVRVTLDWLRRWAMFVGELCDANSAHRAGILDSGCIPIIQRAWKKGKQILAAEDFDTSSWEFPWQKASDADILDELIEKAVHAA
ncbi:hypothetical protein BOTBODRAFT_180144 [Botryobasidium botryosum FD-172 SS1]|uniref:DUF6535 domain-containing protein n=1 Tax=Botryobasidium botryosum (strain FD-172 SS1) TaxID=930990 RepID=A0A067LY10_BOTB1|nr:hypothetical protein BOTBODRAFT_180144 [Botryobasidium botryosum FD-172 SS1]